MLWEHEPHACVSTAFSSSPKLSRVFLQLDRNTENMFSISLRKHRDDEKENNLLTLRIIKIYYMALVCGQYNARSNWLSARSERSLCSLITRLRQSEGQ